MLILKQDLHVDTVEYQRNPEDYQKRVLDIARTWSYRKAGSLSVSLRPDGTTWIFDGGTRHAAAMLRDDVTELDCMVFEIGAVKDEAQAFVDVNTLLKGVAPCQKHHALVKAEYPLALDVERMVGARGYTIPRKHESGRGIVACVQAVYITVQRDKALAEKVFGLVTEIAEGDQVRAEIVRGLFFIAQRDDSILRGENAKKLVAFGQEALATEIARKKAIVGKGGERVEAAALVDVVNKSRRTRKLSLGA
jgi:hypothetical protein